MIVGYKLIDSNGNVMQDWGGIWGQCPNAPNPLFLPTGDHIHAPRLNESYQGYTLIEWDIERPATLIPESISSKQIRLLLLQKNMLDDIENMIAQQDRSIQIVWEYAQEFRRNDPLLIQLIQNLGLTSSQIDDFFVEAALL